MAVLGAGLRGWLLTSTFCALTVLLPHNIPAPLALWASALLQPSTLPPPALLFRSYLHLPGTLPLSLSWSCLPLQPRPASFPSIPPTNPLLQLHLGEVSYDPPTCGLQVTGPVLRSSLDVPVPSWGGAFSSFSLPLSASESMRMEEFQGASDSGICVPGGQEYLSPGPLGSAVHQTPTSGSPSLSYI